MCSMFCQMAACISNIYVQLASSENSVGIQTHTVSVNMDQQLFSEFKSIGAGIFYTQLISRICRRHSVGAININSSLVCAAAVL